MNTETIKFIIDLIADHIGLAVQGVLRTDHEGEIIILTPTDGHPNDLFSICIRPGWRSIAVFFQPGQFSAPLILHMGKCGPEGRSIFTAFTTRLLARNIKILMRVNGTDLDPANSENWPVEWKKLEMSVKNLPIDSQVESVLKESVSDMVVPFLGMIAALIGVEESKDSFTGAPEGAEKQAVVTYYERKKINREACIQLHGTRCCVCRFDFAEHYGPIGVGYIEVHHLIPVSKLGENYCINIQNDLVPICSNCHSMAHREDPPISIERLRILVSQRSELIKGINDNNSQG